MKRLYVATVAMALLATMGCSSSNAPAPAASTPAAAAATVATAVSPTASPTPLPSIETPRPATEVFTLDLTILAKNKSGDACGGGYNLEFASVTVKDEHGTIIGSGTTGPNVRPEPTPYPRTPDVNDPQYAAFVSASATCLVAARIPVPHVGFYQLMVGTHGAPTYSFDDLFKQGFKLTLSLQ